MSGTNYTQKWFLINRLSFSTDGTFTTDKTGWDSKGTYSKKDGIYHLTYELPAGYEMDVTKISDNHIRVEIIPDWGYYEWLGNSADFYS